MGSDINSWNNVGSGTSISSVIPNGYYQSKICSFEDLDLTPSNIENGVNVFGVSGRLSFSNLKASSALGDPGVKVISQLTDSTSTSAQLNLNHENATYGGADLPTTISKSLS